MNEQLNQTPALTVTDVNRYIKSLIASDEVLSAVAIRGEISNFKAHSSGHLYFTLKDEGAEIAALPEEAFAEALSAPEQKPVAPSVAKAIQTPKAQTGFVSKIAPVEDQKPAPLVRETVQIPKNAAPP